MKKSTINFTVSLDENHIPEKIEWAASDTGEEGIKEAKALMISLWDEKENNTLRMDLWTKKMMVDEMRHFFMQSLIISIILSLGIISLIDISFPS